MVTLQELEKANKYVRITTMPEYQRLDDLIQRHYGHRISTGVVRVDKPIHITWLSGDNHIPGKWAMCADQYKYEYGAKFVDSEDVIGDKRIVVLHAEEGDFTIQVSKDGMFCEETNKWLDPRGYRSLYYAIMLTDLTKGDAKVRVRTVDIGDMTNIPVEDFLNLVEGTKK